LGTTIGHDIGTHRRRTTISERAAGTGEQRTPRSVAVFGSCTTRDNFNSRFNPDYRSRYDVTLAASQASVITMMSPPVEADFTPTRPMSDYDLWNIRSDMSREFLPKLAEQQPDYLILDFFADIHFGVIRLPDGRYLTNNRWKLWHTDYYQDLKANDGFVALRILEDPEPYVALWAEALDRFAAYVAEHCPDTTVLVHCGFNTDRLVPPGSSRPVHLRTFKKGPRLDVPRANELWARLDDHATSTYGWDAIDLRAEGYTTTADHPWGPFWVHYTPDYYHRFLAELDLVDLRRSLPPDDLARVEAIAEAGREHAAAYARQWDEALRAQEERIEELENLGALRAVKFALGRRVRQARARRAAARARSSRPDVPAETDPATQPEESR
jgi:hypothetical protein